MKIDVTIGMVAFAKRFHQCVPSTSMATAIESALSHPDFLSQIRNHLLSAVPGAVTVSCDCENCHCGNNGDAQRVASERAHNACREEVLANIYALLDLESADG